MIKPTNKLILKSRRKRLIKKIILMIILLIVGIMFFITKSNVFIVKKVAILGNPIMSGEDVKERTEYLLGQNIFFVDKENIVNEAKKNPYVETVKISKVYPKLINITLTEKQGVYYFEKDDMYYVFSDEAILLEKTNDIENRNLIQLIVNNENDISLGDKISDNIRISNVLNMFSKISKANPTNYKLDSIDISDLMNIKVYIGQVEGRIGSDENIPDKMNKFLHIVQNEQIGITKGYVDVGFDGSPIYYKEEVKNEEGN